MVLAPHLRARTKRGQTPSSLQARAFTAMEYSTLEQGVRPLFVHHAPHLRPAGGRRGIILLIVLALLALFTVVGVSFLLYASAEAQSARINSEADRPIRPDMDTELALSLVFSQILYPVPDNELGLYSSLRGWDMARSAYSYSDLYGYYIADYNTQFGGYGLQSYVDSLNTNFYGANWNNPTPNLDLIAFNGTGRIREGLVQAGGRLLSYTPPSLAGTTGLQPNGQMFSWIDPNGSGVALDVNGAPVSDPAKQTQFYVDPYELLNYMVFRDAQGKLVDTVLSTTASGRPMPHVRDPERPGQRRFHMPTFNPNSPPLNDLRDQSQDDPTTGYPIGSGRVGPRGLKTGGINAPYTYPDVNSLFVAKVLSDGRVILPSYWRPNPAFPTLDPTNSNWTDASKPWLKYMVLRPRPADHAGFPPPEEGPTLDPNNPGRWLSPGGDVKNKLGSPGGNDSFWQDLGLPVQTAPNGQKYKMMAAILIEPIDNRVNVNVHGNIMGYNPLISARDHGSNQGFGAWEVNLGRVLNAAGSEWQNLFVGKAPTSNAIAPAGFGRLSLSGRYGPNGTPDSAGTVAAPGRMAHYYAQSDVNGVNELAAFLSSAQVLPYSTVPNSPSYNFVLPGLRVNGGFNSAPSANSIFPAYPTGTSNGSVAERTNLAALYSSLFPGGDDRSFPPSNMEALLRYYETNSQALGSDLLRLCPANLVGTPATPSTQIQAAMLRRLITTHSFDLDRPGASPYWTNNPSGTSTYVSSPVTSFPSGIANGLPFPDLAARGTNTVANSPSTIPPLPSEFSPDWRSLTAAIGKVDLNRTLTPYPLASADPASPTNQTLPQDALSYKQRFDDLANTYLLQGFSNPADQFKQAQDDRQKLADAIYRRFLAAVGLPPMSNPADPTLSPADRSNLSARRWLAQLAVNIVDYIDEDDISTPFNFYTTVDGLPLVNIGDLADTNDPNVTTREIPRYWVFGTEMPRIMVNEALAQIPQYAPPGAPALNKPPVFPTGSVNSRTIRVSVELYNPLVGAAVGSASSPLQNQDTLPVQLRSPAIANGTSLKRLGAESVYFPANSPYAQATDYEAYRLMLASNFWLTPNNQNDNVTGKVQQPAGISTPTYETFKWPNTIPKEDLQKPDSTAAGDQNSYIKAGEFFLVSFARTGGDAKDPTFDGSGSTIPPSTRVLRSSTMSYVYPTVPGAPDEAKLGLTVALRRLANPHIPFDPNPVLSLAGQPTIVNPWYNPYITTDYLDKIPIREGSNSATTPMVSRGRTQPMTGYTSYDFTGVPLADQVTPIMVPLTNDSPVKNQTTAAANANNSYHTFGIQNAPLPLGTVSPIPTAPNNQGTYAATTLPVQTGQHYDWLVHLDRQLVSPIELFFVSAYQPYQLTQYFMQSSDPTQTGLRYQHLAPWLRQDPSANPADPRIYRALELFTTHSFTPGTAVGGRQAGKINLNMVYDQATLQAIADPQPPNYFYLITTAVPDQGASSLTPPSSPATPVNIVPQYWSKIGGGSIMGIFDPSKGVPWAVSANDILILDLGQPNADAVQVVSTDLSTGKILVVPLNTQVGLHQHGSTFTVFKDVFTSPNVTGLPAGYFRELLLARDGNLDPAAAPSTTPRPFLSTATGFSPAYNTGSKDFMHLAPSSAGAADLVPRGAGIADTMYRNDSSNTNFLFGIPNAPHQYAQFELYNKMFNNVTNRSNTFAVYVTVGFFEVVDDTTRPVKLGAEIGRTENKNVRHRMFAIVDRTQMRAFTTQADPSLTAAIQIPTGATYVDAVVTPVTPPGNATGDNLRGVNPNTGRPWMIQPGTVLVIDTGGNEETITVATVTPPNLATNPPTPGSFAARFTRSHANNVVIYARGNPGPWMQNNFIGSTQANVPTMNYYDPRKDQGVVPHFSLID